MAIRRIDFAGKADSSTEEEVDILEKDPDHRLAVEYLVESEDPGWLVHWSEEELHSGDHFADHWQGLCRRDQVHFDRQTC